MREHLAMRMKRRAEIQKREAEAAGHPNVFARATSPHFSSIQNVRFSASNRPNDDLPTHRRPVSPPPRSRRAPTMSTTPSFVRTSGSRKRKHLVRPRMFHSHHYRNRGVQLLMDFGVMDTSSCTPMNHTFVEIWHGEPPCVPTIAFA